MAIVCRQCGKHNADGVQFCANPDCGAYLGWDGREQTSGVPGVPPPVADTQNASAAVTLADVTLAVDPGDTATTTVTVYNGGSQVEQFAMTVLGPAAAWATVEPATLQVYPAGHAECTVRLAPPREVTTPAGRVWFTVRASSTLHPGLLAGANGTLDVGAFREVGAVLVPQETSGRGRTEHRVDITNAGNVIEPVRLDASDATGKIHFGVPEGELVLPPGKHPVVVPVRPPTRWLGKPPRAPFTVTVTPHPPLPPIRLDGTREVVPLIAGWVPKAAAAVAGVALVAALFLIPGSPLGPKKPAAHETGDPGSGATATVAPPTVAATTGVPTPTGAATTRPPTSAPPTGVPPPAQIVVVNAAGAKARGAQGSAVRHLGAGKFEVTFNTDMRNCSYVATIGDAGSQPVAAGLVSTANGGTNNAVAVETRTFAGTLTDFPFHLQTQCAGRGLWVVGAATGNQLRGNGVAAFNRVGTGQWEVTFSADTRDCAYLATVGDAGSQPASPGLVFTSGGRGGNNGVVVATRTTTGAAKDLPFHLQVVCGEAARWLVSDQAAQQRRGTAVSSTHVGPGQWEVVFTGDVHACAYVATIGQPGREAPATAGLVYTASGQGGNSSVHVTTKTNNGVAVDFPFHLQTAC